MVLYPPVDQLTELDVDPMFDMKLDVPDTMGIRDRRDSSDRNRECFSQFTYVNKIQSPPTIAELERVLALS